MKQLVAPSKPDGDLCTERENALQPKKKRTTILITTHYMEEARQASVVGLMRNGYLLAEENPNTLMQTYNLATLEEVFLKLCVKQNSQVSLIVL